MKLKAFHAVRPQNNDIAGKLASVPYDVVNVAEARVLAKENPLSFLHVSRSDIDFDDGVNPYSNKVYEKARKNYMSLLEDGFLIREKEPMLYVYRQKIGHHVQCGLVTCCSIEDYESEVILKHENTIKDLEDDRTNHLKNVRANTGPVFLAYRDEPRVDAIIEEIIKQTPLYSFTAIDGVGHTVWQCGEKTKDLVKIFKGISTCYIADGHHRAAAAKRVAADIRKKKQNVSDEFNWFLALLYPASDLKVLAYNRIVKDLNGLSKSEFLKAVGGIFKLTPDAVPIPSSACTARMYLSGKWYALSWEDDQSLDPVARLDISRLHDQLLGPVLGIKDPRTDHRVDVVGGIRGPGELVRKVDSGEFAVAFSMYPVNVNQIMSVADSKLIMPPTSTWFEPKPRSGLLIHEI